MELRLDRPDRQPLAVRACVGVVEVRPAIEKVGVALRAPHTHCPHVIEHGHQRRRAIDHRAVHHLPLARRLCLDDPRQQAKSEIKRPAAKIADQIERRRGRFILATHRMQCPGQRDVINVVTRHLRPRPRLPPPGHAPIDQPRIPLQRHIRADTQALHHAWPESLQQPIRLLDQAQRRLDPLRLLQVNRDRPFASVGQVRMPPPRTLGPVNSHDVRTKIGQQHPAERPRSDPRELHDLHANKGPRRHNASPLCGSRKALLAPDVKSIVG